MFPVFFGFRGGKGILSGGTIVLMLDWRVALVAWGLFAVLWLSTKYVSLGSIAATASMPVTTFFVFSHNVLYTVLSAAIAALVHLVPPRATSSACSAGHRSGSSTGTPVLSERMTIFGERDEKGN